MILAWLTAAALAQQPGLIGPVPQSELTIAWPGDANDDGPHTVTVDLTVNERGEITLIQPVSGLPPFRDALIDALTDLRFLPAREDGVPVEVVIPFTWVFRQPAINLAGVVRVSGDRRPAAGVDLAVGDAAVTTDAGGGFQVRGVPEGEVVVRLLSPGLRMSDARVDILPDERVDLELWVVEERWGSEVVGTYSADRGVTVRRSLTYEDIRDAPGGLGDPVRALQNLPGLARTPLDAGWLMLRGGFPEDTPVFLDGVQIPALYHLGGLTSILHPEAVERIDLYPGATPARLSRGLSGAAEMTSRRLSGDLKAVGGVNVAFAHLFAEAPLGEDGGVSIAGRRSYLDGVLSAVLGPERARIAPRFWDAQVRVDTPHAGLMITGMLDEASFPAEAPGNLDDASQRAVVIQGRAEADLGPAHLLVRPWLSVNHTDIDGFRQETVRDLSPGARVEVSGAHQRVDWLMGVEGLHRSWRIERDGEGRENSATYLDPYAELTGDYQDLRVRAGVRVDTLFVPGHLPRAGLSPRLDGRVALTESTTVTAALWRSHQEPPRTFLLGYPDGPYLPLEQATGASIGARTGGPGWGLEADLWGRRLDDVVGFETDGTLQGYAMRAAGVETRSWAVTGRVRGELIYQYTLSRAAAEPGDAYRSIRFEQPHRVVALLSAKLPKDWSFGSRWRFASGVPIVGESIIAYDILQQRDRTTDATPGGRLPPYHALDLRVSRRFTFRKWRLNAFLDVQNVYSRRIPEPAINGIDETLLVYGYGLPILPLFGVDAELWPGRR